jgi:hypothetical protein
MVPVQREERTGILGLRTRMVTTNEERETQVEVLPSHWELFRTTHWIEDRRAGTTSEYNEQNLWVLTEGGDLLYVWKWEEYARPPGSDRGRFDSEVTVTPMTKERMLQLDHAHPSYDHRRGAFHCWGSREPGRLVRHAPGVGISLLMKRLLSV